MVTLKQLALKYREELSNYPNREKADEIAKRINSLKDQNGKLISIKKKFLLVKYIENPTYDAKTGMELLNRSDNSAFLNLVAAIRDKIKER
ncbi:MAG: hypothetical protein KBT11_04260 [Treponema sp.]|nr:hypothetical protein [Candidatus Treponema equifaecale]